MTILYSHMMKISVSVGTFCYDWHDTSHVQTNGPCIFRRFGSNTEKLVLRCAQVMIQCVSTPMGIQYFAACFHPSTGVTDDRKTALEYIGSLKGKKKNY